MNACGASLAALTRILDEVGAIVWEGDPNTYAFTYVSPAAERLLGYPAQRWLDDPCFWMDHIHPDDRDWVLTYCKDCTSRLEEHQFDYRMLAADGRVVWLRDVVRVEGEAGRPVRSIGVMMDVTSLKLAEARASEATERFRGCLRGAPIVFFALDMHRNFTVWEGMELGPASNQVVGMSLDHVYAHNPTILAAARRALAGEELVVRVEERGQAFEISWMPIDEHGQRTGVVGVATNVTRRVEAESALLTVLETMPDIIAVLDSQGRVEVINHLPAQITSRAELDAIGLAGLLDACSGEAWRSAFAEVVATGERRELEVTVRPPDGPPRWFMTRITPIGVRGRGRPKDERYLSISTDVTARKQLEAQLRQQARLESIGTLASGVAHEINNPIQGILNYAELIVERAGDPDSVRDFAGEITHESKRVATIVRNLLAFSRREVEQHFDECDVRTLIDDSLALIHSILCKDQITVQLDAPEGVPRIRCRMQQIQQIVLNLVANARDAINERGEADEIARSIDIRVRVHAREGRRWVRISVGDRGLGIPESVRQRIFDPFFTTKGRHRGTGLGLSVSHGIAVDHGGELSVDSDCGLGSTFHLDLPVDGPGSSASGSGASDF